MLLSFERYEVLPFYFVDPDPDLISFTSGLQAQTVGCGILTPLTGRQPWQRPGNVAFPVGWIGATFNYLQLLPAFSNAFFLLLLRLKTCRNGGERGGLDPVGLGSGNNLPAYLCTMEARGPYKFPA